MFPWGGFLGGSLMFFSFARKVYTHAFGETTELQRTYQQPVFGFLDPFALLYPWVVVKKRFLLTLHQNRDQCQKTKPSVVQK